MIRIFICIIFLTKLSFSQDFDVIKDYDKFSKETTIKLDEKLVVKGENSMFNLVSYVYYIYNATDTSYWWSFYTSYDKKVLPSKEDKISLLLDDVLTELYPNEVDADASTVMLYYYITVSRELLVSMSNAKQVAVQLKNKDFKFEGNFKKDDLKILKQFFKKY